MRFAPSKAARPSHREVAIYATANPPMINPQLLLNLEIKHSADINIMFKLLQVMIELSVALLDNEPEWFHLSPHEEVLLPHHVCTTHLTIQI